MKKVIFGLVSFLFAVNAHAAMAPEFRSLLNKFDMEQGTSLANDNTGDVSINMMTGEIILHLTRTAHVMCVTAPCPQPHIAYPSHDYTVKITDVKTGACGETIYVGKDFKLPVDGPNLKIQVIDNSSNTCETFQIIPPVEVKLDIVLPRGGKPQHHEMQGSTFFELQ